MKKKLTDDFLGKYAILQRGYAKGIIGLICKNTTGLGVSDYMHSTLSGLDTVIAYQEEIKVVNIND